MHFRAQHGTLVEREPQKRPGRKGQKVSGRLCAVDMKTGERKYSHRYIGRNSLSCCDKDHAREKMCVPSPQIGKLSDGFCIVAVLQFGGLSAVGLAFEHALENPHDPFQICL